MLNLLTATINVVQLIRLRRRREIFRLLEVRPESQYLRYFLDFQTADIGQFFPEFQSEVIGEPDARFALFVLRDLIPAGVLLGTIRGEKLDVALDYAVPQYRDLKIGQFLFRDEADFFRRRGIREIVAHASTDVHARYLERMGFDGSRGREYRLRLA